MSIREKEALVERLHQQYILICDDTRGNPFVDCWDNISFKNVSEDFSADSDQQMIRVWFEPIMELN